MTPIEAGRDPETDVGYVECVEFGFVNDSKKALKPGISRRALSEEISTCSCREAVSNDP